MSEARPSTAAQRIAGAPISWGISEVRGWGHQMGPDRVLREMRTLGLSATEAGPDGFLPDEPVELREFLAAYDMSLVGGFMPLVLHRGDDEWRAPLEAVARRFAAAGADMIVLAAGTGLADYNVRPELSAEDWKRLLSALDAASELAARHGLRSVVHPHAGTLVEKPAEIVRVLEASSASLCLDTGHVSVAGGDPEAIARQAPERIGHVHLKDVHAATAARVRSGELTFSDAVRRGVFRPLGDGDVDVRSIVRSLRGAGYEGWYVFEQDVMLEAEPPEGGGPREDVARSLDYLRAAISG